MHQSINQNVALPLQKKTNGSRDKNSWAEGTFRALAYDDEAVETALVKMNASRTDTDQYNDELHEALESLGEDGKKEFPEVWNASKRRKAEQTAEKSVKKYLEAKGKGDGAAGDGAAAVAAGDGAAAPPADGDAGAAKPGKGKGDAETDVTIPAKMSLPTPPPLKRPRLTEASVDDAAAAGPVAGPADPADVEAQGKLLKGDHAPSVAGSVASHVKDHMKRHPRTPPHLKLLLPQDESGNALGGIWETGIFRRYTGTYPGALAITKKIWYKVANTFTRSHTKGTGLSRDQALRDVPLSLSTAIANPLGARRPRPGLRTQALDLLGVTLRHLSPLN